jgi:predicted ATP-grasp superfamily ATP-dependent carboligase
MEVLRQHGLPCPGWSAEPRPGEWILKPNKSAGGLGVQPYTGQPFNPRTHFLQERIEGLPCSAIFLGTSENALLLGVTQQLVGTPWLHASGLHYAGNVGPLLLDPSAQSRWLRLGQTLAARLQLRGLFGVDAIVCDEVPWPVEINPRYTASVEVLERASKNPLLRWHRDCFVSHDSERDTVRIGVVTQESQVCGKAILYARGQVTFPDRGPWLASLNENLDDREYADIPCAGEVIEQGRPVVTLFARAASVPACLEQLQEKARALDRCLWG